MSNVFSKTCQIPVDAPRLFLLVCTQQACSGYFNIEILALSTPPIPSIRSAQPPSQKSASIEKSAPASSQSHLGTDLSPRSNLLLSCKCSSLCLPLVVLLDGPIEKIENHVGMDLIKWAHDVPWSNICLFHLQRLGSLRFDSHIIFLSREELLELLDGVSLSSDSPPDQNGTTMLSIDSGDEHSTGLLDGFDFDDVFDFS